MSTPNQKQKEELLIEALVAHGYYFREDAGEWVIYACVSSVYSYMQRQIAYKVRNNGYISVVALGATLINNTPISSIDEITQLNQEMLLNQSDRLKILKSIGGALK